MATAGIGFVLGFPFDLEIYQGQLVVAGLFDSADGRYARNVAVWSGSGWNQLGSGLSQNVHSLQVVDEQLVAGRVNNSHGALTIESVDIWDGSSWFPLAVSQVDGDEAILTRERF